MTAIIPKSWDCIWLKKIPQNHTKSLLSCLVAQNTLFYISKVYLCFAAFLPGKKRNFKIIYSPSERISYKHTNVQHLKQCPIQFKGLENLFLQSLNIIIMILWFRKGHLLSEHLQKSAVSHKAVILHSSYIKVWGLAGWLKENTALTPMLITQQCNSKKIQLKIEHAFVHSWYPV